MSTKDRIWAAADELDAAGQKPTLSAIRKQVGGGSYTTISDVMAEWRAQRQKKSPSSREQTPEALTDKLLELGADIWGNAMELANGRLAAEREELDAVRVDLQNAQQEAADLADELTAELEQSKSDVDHLKAENQKLKDEEKVLRDQLAVASNAVAIAEARAKELRAELDLAHQEVQQLRAEAMAAREEIGTFKGQIVSLEKQLEKVLKKV